MIKSSSEPCATNTCDVGALTHCGCASAPEPLSAAPAGKAAVAVSGVALAACVACCTLPFALPAAALAFAVPLLLWLEESQAWMVPVAVAAVLSAWLWIGWRSVRSRLRPARATLHAMALATALLIPTLAWPWIEPPLVGFLRG